MHPPGGARGVYKLGNGNYFVTGGTNVYIVTPQGSITSTNYGTGASFRFVSESVPVKVTAPKPPMAGHGF